jgi:hypothetical protein
MTIAEPIPDLQWGKGSWQDYISNWRTRDTNWMQERLILRYQTTAARTADWSASPRAGQVTYNDVTQTLEMWRAGTTNSWVRSLMFQYLVSSQDTSAGVNLFHAGSIASPKAITITPTTLLIDLPTTNFLAGILTIDATGMALKTGAKTVKLTTDAANLVSDSPIKTPSLDLSGGTGTVLNAAGKAVSVGALTADTATIPNITLTGTLGGGGILNGASGTIGAVGLSGGVISVAAGSASASAAGLQSGQGYFYGDGNSAVMRQRPAAASAAGAAYVQVMANDTLFNGNTVQTLGQFHVMNQRSIQYHRADNAVIWNGGPVIYGADPGVANVPEGTIWVS